MEGLRMFVENYHDRKVPVDIKHWDWKTQLREITRLHKVELSIKKPYENKIEGKRIVVKKGTFILRKKGGDRE